MNRANATHEEQKISRAEQIEVEIGTSPILDKNNSSVSGVAAILRRVESTV